MYQYILIGHISIGVLTLLTTVVAVATATRTNAQKYLWALLAGITLQVLSGTYMALLSDTVTAAGLCQNLVLYSIVIGAGCVYLHIRSENIKLKQYLYMLAPAISSYALFFLALIKKV